MRKDAHKNYPQGDKILEMIKSKGENTLLGVDLALSRGWVLEDIASFCSLYPTDDYSGYICVRKVLRLNEANYLYFRFQDEFLIIESSVKGVRKEYNSLYNESIPRFYDYVVKFLRQYKKTYHSGN